MAKVPEVTISSNVEKQLMPVIGMGTCSYPPADHATVKSAVLEAIKVGYRHFDTAFAYGSEKPLGEAIVEALQTGLIKSRDELFITTKLWCSFAHPDQIVPACKMSLQNLQLEYVDMYLIHHPIRLTEVIRKTPVEVEIIRPIDLKGVWEGMEECIKLGLTKGIGVSNFSCEKLQEVLCVATIPPAVNQVELNPVWQQKRLVEFCKAKGIHITAYSPLGANNTKWGDNRVLDSDVLREIANARGKSTAQVKLIFFHFKS
ncbi:OLC1v1033052C1 [Oldenlandia corymbosa var. corymbosa]|uniref:OLC1v1033052C1 n=1 Tax=Oldenlandia corymbosa var. corymbosa TaxID=529605 RepID=A0AAV1CQG8_OLDCO|nr:OLC1v1033052C1 [Oldenlandia corymbosa var. corymbosa]